VEWSLVVQNGFEKPIFDSSAHSGSIVGWETVKGIAEAIIIADDTAEKAAWDILMSALPANETKAGDPA
jgi:hypothetical protein